MMHDERGLALIITLIALALLSAIGAALVLATNADVLIAANAGASSEAFYAAEAAFERTVAELHAVGDLTSLLDGSIPSSFTDGLPSGVRTLSDGSRLQLETVVNLANCQKRNACTDTDMNAALRDRPWGMRNPRWRLFSYGPLRAPGGSIPSDLPVYVVSLVADDPWDTDGNPATDGARIGSTVNPGAGMVLVRAEGFGRRGARRVVQGFVFRRDRAAVVRWEALDPLTRGEPPVLASVAQVLAWEEIR